MASFTPLPLSPRERSLRYLFYRRLNGPQNRFGRCGEKKNMLPLPGIETRPSNPQSVPIPPELQMWPSLQKDLTQKKILHFLWQNEFRTIRNLDDEGCIMELQEKPRKLFEKAVSKNSVLYILWRKSSLIRARVNYYWQWMWALGNHRQECQTKSKFQIT